MRRKTGPKQRPWRPYDTRKDLKPEWLASLGAVNVAWNDIEGALDVAMCIVLELPYPMWIEVTSRINGLDGKFAIIKKAARAHFKLPVSVCDLIDATVGAVAEHKGYRDSLIHARILDPDSEVAPSNQTKGVEYEVLVSQAALDGLYDRLSCLQHETDAVLKILHNRALLLQLCRKEPKIDRRDPRILENVQAIRGHGAQLQEHQNLRRSLPPLPQFPKELPIPEAMEAGPTDPA